MKKVTNNWHWPALIAHRGAGTLAPENTLAALRAGHDAGYRMVEFDVRLTRDAVPVLFHDDTLQRTSNGTGNVDDCTLEQLQALDFGAWHSPLFAGEGIPTLEAVAAYTQANQIHCNIEIKSSSARQYESGRVIAHAVSELWNGVATPPLVSSFSRTVLEAVRDTTPELPRALLLDTPLPAGWKHRLDELGCMGINLNDRHISHAVVDEILAAGHTLVAWTVNSPVRARTLLDWGCHAVVTDAIDQINPADTAGQAKRSPSPR